MTEPYLFERAIGQQMGDLCRLAVGDAKVTQTGEIVTLEDMLGRGVLGVSVEVPYTSGGVQSVNVERCGKNLLKKDVISTTFPQSPDKCFSLKAGTYRVSAKNNGADVYRLYATIRDKSGKFIQKDDSPFANNSYRSASGVWMYSGNTAVADITFPRNRTIQLINDCYIFIGYSNNTTGSLIDWRLELGSTATAYEPYNGDTYTITLPADFYGGSIDLTTGTVTSIYAADGSLLAEPVVTEIDPISIPILAGINNIWADVGTVTVSYYAADAQTFRPALWYPTIYRGLTSARYLIKRASGEIASFDDAIAAPLVGLRVALPWRSEGWKSVSVTVNGTLTTITLPTTIYGGYLDVVTGQLVATHDENGNALANQKLYFLDPVNVSALAGVNSAWSDAGDVAVSYRVEQ